MDVDRTRSWVGKNRVEILGEKRETGMGSESCKEGDKNDKGLD